MLLQGTELSAMVVASRYRDFSYSCDLFVRIISNFNFEFKMLTDRNKLGEMFITAVVMECGV